MNTALLSSTYDIVFLSIIAFSTILAFIRGGIAEMLSLSTWFIAFWALHKFGTEVASFIPDSIQNNLFRNVITFIVIFLATAIIMALVKKLLANFIKTIGLGSLNYMLGILFGVIRGIFVCALLIIIIQALQLDNNKSYTQAKLFPVLYPVSSWIINAIPDDAKHIPPPPNSIINLYKDNT